MATTLNVIKTITIRGTTQGVQQSTQELNQLAGAQRNVATASETMTRATLSTERAVNNARRALDTNFRAAQDHARTQQTLNRGLMQGVISQQDYAQTLAMSQRRLQQSVRTTDEYGRVNRLSRYELINLSRQLQDVGVGLASGQRLFTIMIQQGTQIADVFATSGLTLRGFVGQLGSMLTVGRVVVGGIAAIAAGALFAANVWKNWALALADAARAAGIATETFFKLQQAFEFKGVSPQQFNQAMAQMAQNVHDANRGLGFMAELFRVNGIQARTTEDAIAAVSDLLRRMTSDVQRISTLRNLGIQVTPELIRAMSQGGDAIRQAMNNAVGLNKNFDEMEKKARDIEEAFNKTWTKLRAGAIVAIGDAIQWVIKLWDKVKEFFEWTRGIDRPLRIDVTKQFETLPAPSAGRPPADPDQIRKENQWLQQRVGILGEIATASQRAAAVDAQINLARQEGVRITKEEQERLRGIAELRRESELITERATLGLTSWNDAMKEANRQIDILTLKGTLGPRKIGPDEQDAVALQIYIKTLREMVPAFREVHDAAQSFATSFVQGLLQGKSVIQSITQAASQLASTMSSRALNSLFEGKFEIGAVQAAIAGVAALISALGKQSEEERRRAQVREQAQANAADFLAQIRGTTGSQTAQLRSIMNQARGLIKELTDARDFATLNQVLREGTAAIAKIINDFLNSWDLIRQTLESGLGADSPIVQARAQVISALQQVREFVEDTRELRGAGVAEAMGAGRTFLLSLLRTQPELTDTATRLQEITGTAQALQSALVELGLSAEEAARAISEGVTAALEELRAVAIDDLNRAINEALNQGYINDFIDLFDQVNSMFADFASLGLDASRINTFFVAAAQNIVDQAQLTGQAFLDLLTVFPQLTGVVHEFVATVEETTVNVLDPYRDAIEQTTRAIDEARSNLLEAYNNEKQALEQTIDRMRQFTTQLRAFRQSLLLNVGVSPLTPEQRFLEAQRQFRETALLAAQGNEEALGNLQNVSQAYLDEARSFYASSEDYFRAFSEVQDALTAAADAAANQVDVAQAQLDALKQQVGLLIDINDNVMSVADAIANLNALIPGGVGGRDWGANPLRNQAIVAALQTAGITYSGGFGGGQFNTWAAQLSLQQQALVSAITDMMIQQYGQMGGLITNGVWNVDSVLARHANGGNVMLAGGEFVTRAPSVTSATLPTLAHINATGSVPANDNRLAKVIIAENAALRAEIAALRAEFSSSMKRLADVSRQSSNQAQQKRAI